MQQARNNRGAFYLLMTAAVLLIVISVWLLARTFRNYNDISLRQQDTQLESMAKAADAGMASYLDDFRDELRYIIGRRGFVNAEKHWHETGDAADLLSRMQENLLAGNPLIGDLVLVDGAEICLSSNGNTEYYFPDGIAGALQPCFAADGTMYLAVFENGNYARFAVLLHMKEWYANLSMTYASDSIRLMLLGRQQRILLHTWQGQHCVSVVDDLSSDNSDIQAAEYLMQSQKDARKLITSYSLTYPEDDYVHEMRMTVLPLAECTNGYFSVSLTSDYDEIIVPMQAAAWWMLVSGALLVSGVLLMILTAVLLVRQNRSRDRALEQLLRRNEETQKLLDMTTELAHHQRLETIGTLTASIAHEFNNLLTPIMGYSILTLEGLPEEYSDLADNVAEIYEASRKAKAIISRLNSLSRRNAEESFRPLALPTLVSKALSVAAPAMPPNVTPCVKNEAGELWVSGSETQLSQLLLNLILNAYQAMEATGGTLTLTLREQDGQALVLVEDTGSGIPADVIGRIFDPFYTTKESGRGTGLGLAIVRQVAESHHGEISVASILGKGTIFTLCLPSVSPAESDNS